MEPMYKAQGYWVSRNGAERIDFEVSGTCVQGYGSPAVRFDGHWGEEGMVLLTLGGKHSSAVHSPSLLMSLDTAVALIELLRAAVHDGLIVRGAALEPIPFVDVTAAVCDCHICAAEPQCECPACVPQQDGVR